MKTSVLNMALMTVGTILVAIGAFRTFPLQIDKKFWVQNGPLMAAFIVVIALATFAGGTKVLQEAIDGTTRVTASFVIILVLLMPIIGFSGPLAKYYEGTIAGVLESRFGYVWAFVCAFLSPSGNAFSGVIQTIWPDKPGLRPLFLYFLTAVPLSSLSIFYIRRLGLSEEICKEMYKANLLVAIFLMPFFWAYGKWFYR